MPRVAVVSNSPDLKGNYIWRDATDASWQVQTFLPFPARQIEPPLLEAAWTTRTAAITPPRLSESFRLDVGLRSVLREFAPDVIHFVGEPWGFGLRTCLSLDVPTVIHGAENRYTQGNYWLDRVRVEVSARNLRRVAGAVGWNTHTVKAMCETGLSEGVPTAVFPATTRLRESPAKEPARQRQDELTVVFVGRLAPEKGVDVLLRAVDETRSLVRFRIVGDGPLRATLEAQRSTADGRVEFLGSRTQRQSQELIRAGDVLVLPSRDQGYVCEQFGLVLVEAMAEGTAIVASDVCSIPEVVGGFAQLVPPDDHIALAQALNSLAEDDNELARLSQLSASHYSTYSPESLNRVAKDLWSSVLA